MDPAARCPLCGGANDCGVVQGKSDCWCFSTPMTPELLAQVPEDLRGVACVCRRCAESAAPAPAADSDESSEIGNP